MTAASCGSQGVPSSRWNVGGMYGGTVSTCVQNTTRGVPQVSRRKGDSFASLGMTEESLGMTEDPLDRSHAIISSSWPEVESMESIS